MKILCTGDVHIGRRSTRLPPAVDTAEHSTAEAWKRVVDTAISQEVDVLAISGDLIDRANRYFEAVGSLERGLARLIEKDIVTVMVAGNHDHDVLPAMASRFESDRVRLLGRGGTWERMSIERAGSRLHIDGWSFPRGHHATSPLADYAPPMDGAPVVALVHADLDQPASPYAPVSIAELRRYPHVLFVLGHVHTGHAVSEPGGARYVYPGSPQALDPGERGPHGVHLIELSAGAPTAKSIPISTVRYELFDIEMDGVEGVEEVDGRIALGVTQRLAECEQGAESLRHLRCRVRLTGSTAVHRMLDDRLALRTAELDLGYGAVRASVETLEVATRPDRDLVSIAAGPGPASVLARLLLGLEAGTLSPADEQLLARATRVAGDMRRVAPYLEVLEPQEPSHEERSVAVAAELRRAAGLLLDEMLAQKEEVA